MSSHFPRLKLYADLILLFQDTIHEALLARLYDPSAAVLTALYTPDFIPIVSAAGTKYLTSLEDVLQSMAAPPSKAILRVHVTFLVGPYLSQQKHLHDQMGILNIIWPLMLASKKRKESVRVVWEVLSAVDAGAFDGILNDCGKIWKEGAEDGGIEAMNGEMAKLVAR